ncbi:MAG: glutathione synthase, partial [Burkholderiaceae bacterium]
MKIAFLADPLDSFKIYKDTTYAMMAEAARRGHQLYAFEQGDLAWEGGMVVADTAQITLTGDPHNWYRAAASRTTALAEFDAILLRKDPPFDMEYVYTTYLLERAEAQGARVVNRPRAVRDHNEKLAITEFARFVAPTIVTRDERRLRDFHAEHRDLIFKPLDGMGGTGIFRVRDDELNLGAIIEMLTDNGRRTIMAQRFIPQVADGDKRILLIGGRVVPYCLARIPQGTEVRGNLAAGGVGVAQPI